MITWSEFLKLAVSGWHSTPSYTSHRGRRGRSGEESQAAQSTGHRRSFCALPYGSMLGHSDHWQGSLSPSLLAASEVATTSHMPWEHPQVLRKHFWKWVAWVFTKQQLSGNWLPTWLGFMYSGPKVSRITQDQGLVGALQDPRKPRAQAVLPTLHCVLAWPASCHCVVSECLVVQLPHSHIESEGWCSWTTSKIMLQNQYRAA